MTIFLLRLPFFEVIIFFGNCIEKKEKGRAVSSGQIAARPETLKGAYRCFQGISALTLVQRIRWYI